MAYARVKIWIAAEILTAADQNAEFSNCIDNENDLDTRLVAEVAARTTLESEHDTLQTNLWNAGASEVAANRVSQNSMKNDAVGNSELKALAVTHEKVAAANKDGAVDIPSMRTLGIEALQACPGTDSRFLARMKDFTENGTFTAESTEILLEMWSGGGGGGGGARQASGGWGGGGGGGSGRYAKKMVTVVVGTEYSVVVGVKGDGGNGGTEPHPDGYDAGDGGNSSLGTNTVFGGGGGKGGTGSSAGAGGAAGTGGTMPTYPGELGVAGQAGQASNCGGDGRKGSYFGGSLGAGGARNTVGGDAAGYSGSGGGGGSPAAGPGKAGGDGAPGLVRITW
jgi:hypothetical protein